MKFGVVQFPGSCDERDALAAARRVGDAELLWHAEAELPDVGAVVLPGGFSYGDYLRCGAIARFAPVMEAVHRFADDGGLVLGICNGFQVLCEAGLLPGALRPNASLEFVCRDVALRLERADTPFTSRGTGRPRTSLDLVVLDQRVREQPLAHLADPRGIVDVELHQPADVHVRHALEPERGQCPLHGLALRVQDPGLGPDQDPHSQGAVRSSQAEKGSPASRS